MRQINFCLHCIGPDLSIAFEKNIESISANQGLVLPKTVIVRQRERVSDRRALTVKIQSTTNSAKNVLWQSVIICCISSITVNYNILFALKKIGRLH